MGSLRRALRLWTDLAHRGTGAEPFSVRFTYVCRSEARARRLAAALRRGLACAAAMTTPSSRPRSASWHVHGRTRALPQSLANLQQLSNWLRELAERHQVSLIRLTLARPAA